jgi:hypothetical protein
VSGPAQHEDHRREAGQVDIQGVRPERDVVAEDRRGLIAVDGAPDVGEDAHVVERGQVVHVETEAFAEAQADPCGPDHVLRRLPEPEVGGQRQRDQQVVQPHP